MTENLIIFNARVVTPVGFSARRGREMEELCIIDDATVEVTGGIITYVGPNRGEERDGYYQRYWHYNARGKCLLPGFVDSHTHFVFGGERAEEFSWRLKGESYMSIMERGGGIVSTVKATRECNFIQLRQGRGLFEADEHYGSYHRRGQERLRPGQGNRVAATPRDAQSEQ